MTRVVKRSVQSLVLLVAFTPAAITLAHSWMAPKEAAKQSNPVQADAESIEQGKKLYLLHCAACHGENGKGLSAEETGLEKKTPDLVKGMKSHPEGDYFWKIQNGKGEMPGYKEEINDRDTWNIINYLTSL